jgi:hypothetical protein
MFNELQLLPPNHLDTAIILNNLAVCLHCTGKLVEAFELYKVSLKIFEEKVGLNHPRPILVKRNLTKAQDKYMKEYIFTLITNLLVSNLLHRS